MSLSHDDLKSAVSAVRQGKHTPSHTAVLRNARDFLQNNKSHPWHKSDALRGAIGKVIGESVAINLAHPVNTRPRFQVRNKIGREINLSNYIGPSEFFLRYEEPDVAKKLVPSLLRVAHNIPQTSTFAGGGAEAVAFKHAPSPNPLTWKIYRLSHPTAKKGILARPKHPRVTQAEVVRRFGSLQLERIPYRHIGVNRSPKKGLAPLSVVYDMAKDNLLPLDAHPDNVGTNLKTRRTELVDPGYVVSLRGKKRERVLNFLRTVDPTSMPSAEWHTALRKASENTGVVTPKGVRFAPVVFDVYSEENALGEASIDHFTPELYRGAAQASRLLRTKGGGHMRLGRDSVKVREYIPYSGPKRLFLASEPEDTTRGVARTLRSWKPRSSREKGKETIGGRIRILPGKFADQNDAISHELFHIKDPGPSISLPDDTFKSYLADRGEQHAFSGVGGSLGIRTLKKAGVSKDVAIAGLSIGSMRSAAEVGVLNPEMSAGKLKQSVRRITRRRRLKPALRHMTPADFYLAGHGGEKPKRKIAREFFKGIEREYGPRNTTGGTVNKFGQVKLARPIGMLPEELRGRIARFLHEKSDDEFSVKVNKWGGTNVFQLDRGKPGDYPFWEKHRAQQASVTRPKNPPKPKQTLPRGSFSAKGIFEPKPETAIERVRRLGILKPAPTDEAVDPEASVARIRAKLAPKTKKVSRTLEIKKRLSPVTLVYGPSGSVMGRVTRPEWEYAREVSQEKDNPFKDVWGRLADMGQRRDMHVRHSAARVAAKKQEIYDRVKDFSLSPTKKNVKDVYLGRIG